MKRLIQYWLGITAVQDTLNAILQEQQYNYQRLKVLSAQLETLLPGIARIISKVDASYAQDEISDERKAESNKIGDAVMQKMMAEQAAREKYAPR